MWQVRWERWNSCRLRPSRPPLRAARPPARLPGRCAATINAPLPPYTLHCLLFQAMASNYPLHQAARSGDLQALQGWIADGAKVDVRDHLNRTPVHLAAWAGQLEALRALAEAGADIRAAAQDDMSPLHFAAQKGRTEVVRWLLSQGLHVNSKTRKVGVGVGVGGCWTPGSSHLPALSWVCCSSAGASNARASCAVVAGRWVESLLGARQYSTSNVGRGSAARPGRVEPPLR